MKIGIVSEYYYPLLGGISEHVHNTHRFLSNLGHQVKIITSGHLRGNTQEDSDVCRIGRSVPIYSNGSFARITLGAHISEDMHKILRSENFDILHVHSPLVPTLPLLALRHSTCVNIGTCHTYFDANLWYSLFRGPLLNFYHRLHGRIAVSETCVSALTRYFPDDFRIIPNGIDVKIFDGRYPRIERFDDGKKNILFVGRFDPRNGLSCMLKAFRIVKKRHPNTRLIVLGDGVLRRYYQYLVTDGIRDDVVFEGSVLHERPLYYSACDIFCTPTTKASFGLVLLEAMASGKPIIASDLNGYRNVMRDGCEGILVTPDDPRGYAEAIIRLLEDKDLAGRLGDNGRKRAAQFSWDRVVPRIVDYYSEVMESCCAKASARSTLIAKPWASQDRLAGGVPSQR